MQDFTVRVRPSPPEACEPVASRRPVEPPARAGLQPTQSQSAEVYVPQSVADLPGTGSSPARTDVGLNHYNLLVGLALINPKSFDEAMETAISRIEASTRGSGQRNS